MAATSTSFFSISSSSSLNFRRAQFLYPPNSLHIPSLSHIKKGVWGQRHVLFQVNCVSERDKQTVEPESETTSPPSSSESPSSSAIVAEDDDVSGISAYRWCAALGGIGFLETAYLTYLKLTNSDAFCPTGGGASCTNILTSDYSFVFGVPLPLFGMLAYGLVANIGLQISTKEKTFDSGKSDGDVILIGTTTSMAVASAYFLYILNTEFAGELCLYCLTSAILSFSLFFIALKRFGLDELKKTLGLQLSVAGLVVIALTGSNNNAQSMSTSSMMEEIPYFETEIAKESSPFAVALAKHLQSIGAKLYGAFWCSHCLEQKEIFGGEATKMLDYVECFPDGVIKGNKMAQACLDVKLQGFPTWIINDQVLEGEKQLSELATISGFKSENIGQSN